MNLTISIGRLTAEPSVATVKDTKKAEFNLALDRQKEGADFPRFVAWDKKAELVEKYLHKGMRVGIEGRIHTGSYEGKNGKVYTTDVWVDKIHFLEKKQADETTGQPEENEADFVSIPDGIDEELPFN